MTPINEAELPKKKPPSVIPEARAFRYMPQSGAQPGSKERADEVDLDLRGYRGRLERGATDHIHAFWHILEVRDTRLHDHYDLPDVYTYCRERLNLRSRDHVRRHLDVGKLPEALFEGASLTLESLRLATTLWPQSLEALADCARQRLDIADAEVAEVCAFAAALDDDEAAALHLRSFLLCGRELPPTPAPRALDGDKADKAAEKKKDKTTEKKSSRRGGDQVRNSVVAERLCGALDQLALQSLRMYRKAERIQAQRLIQLEDRIIVLGTRERPRNYFIIGVTADGTLIAICAETAHFIRSVADEREAFLSASGGCKKRKARRGSSRGRGERSAAPAGSSPPA